MNRIRFNIALAGILLALVALWRNDTRITWVAIVVLAVAVVLRIAGCRGATPPTGS